MDKKMKIEVTTENKPLANIVLQVVGIVLGYIRNSFFLMSATMIFFIFVIIQIFPQDDADLNLLGHILLSLENMPLIGKYINIKEEAHVDGSDLAKFFSYLSFIFTIFTEIVYYFRRYVLKAEPRESTWVNLKRRTLLVFVALTFVYFTAFSYLIWQTGDMSTGIFVFLIFWIISVGSTFMFLLSDFLTKRLRKIEI